MMTYDDFFGNKGLIAGLKRSVKAGKAPHALLFVGAYGSGKKSLADIYARALLCPMDDPPCDRCPSCTKVLHASHPDLFSITTEKKKKTIGVDAVVSMQRQAFIKPNEGNHKVFVIEKAECLTIAAQNKLLKVLEEPPRYMSILLLCENTAALLPTVLSRCLKVKMPVVSLKDITHILSVKGVDHETAQRAAAMSRGVVGRALELSQSDEFHKEVTQAAELLFALERPGGKVKAFSVLSNDRIRSSRILAIWQSLLRDCLLLSSGIGDTLENPSERKAFTAYIRKNSKERIIKQLEILLEVERRLYYSAQHAQTMDWLLSAI